MKEKSKFCSTAVSSSYCVDSFTYDCYRVNRTENAAVAVAIRLPYLRTVYTNTLQVSAMLELSLCTCTKSLNSTVILVTDSMYISL
jgi:hypothetical protein